MPGIGFDSNPNAAAILPPPGRLTGSGPDLSVAAAQNNAFRAINSAWKHGATVQLTTGSESRYFISGLSESAQAELVSSLALGAGRAGRASGARRAANCATDHRPPAHRPRPALGLEHGRGVDPMGARTVWI